MKLFCLIFLSGYELISIKANRSASCIKNNKIINLSFLLFNFFIDLEIHQNKSGYC